MTSSCLNLRLNENDQKGFETGHQLLIRFPHMRLERLDEQQQGVLYYLVKVLPSLQLKQMDEKIAGINIFQPTREELSVSMVVVT